MLIGVPKEIKNHEYRVGLAPASVRELVTHGHQVIIESNAGIGIGAPDQIYQEAGAKLSSDPAEIFGVTEMIVCLMAIRDDVLPPTINLENPDPDCDLDYVPNAARETKCEPALNNSFGFGGQNITLVVGAFRG